MTCLEALVSHHNSWCQQNPDRTVCLARDSTRRNVFNSSGEKLREHKHCLPSLLSSTFLIESGYLMKRDFSFMLNSTNKTWTAAFTVSRINISPQNKDKMLHRKESMSRNELIHWNESYRTFCVIILSCILMVMFNVSGWVWSMTVRGTAVQMRPAWAASWLRSSRPRFTDITGPAAANRSSIDTSSKNLICSDHLYISGEDLGDDASLSPY